MTAPDIHSSIAEERREHVREAWKCSILKGMDAEEVYEDYIEGRKSYVEVSMKLRN